MNTLSLPSLEALKSSNSGDIFTNNSEGVFKLFSFVDLEVLELNSNNNPVFNITSNNFNITNGNVYLDGVEFSGYSRIGLGGSSKFKKIISNQITASFDVNNTNQDMFIDGDGTGFVKGTGQFLIHSRPGPSNINNTGYVNRNDWSSGPGSPKEFIIPDYQPDLFFDLKHTSLNSMNLVNPLNNKIIIKLPENYTEGNIFTISFRFDNRTFYKPNPFDIDLQKQGTDNIQIISQYFGNELNSYSILKSKIDIANLSIHPSLNLLYLGNNFFNIDLNAGPFPGINSYEEKSIVMDNLYNQWMMFDL